MMETYDADELNVLDTVCAVIFWLWLALLNACFDLVEGLQAEVTCSICQFYPVLAFFSFFVRVTKR